MTTYRSEDIVEAFEIVTLLEQAGHSLRAGRINLDQYNDIITKAVVKADILKNIKMEV